MYCNKCGNKIPEDANFCTQCGYKVKPDTEKNYEVKQDISTENNCEKFQNVNIEKPVYEIDGKLGTTLRVYEERCVISVTSGGKAFFYGGFQKLTSGDKEFYYCDITTIQFKNLTKTSGYIQFEYPGALNQLNYTSENSFVFSEALGTKEYHQLKQTMQSVYEYIQNKVREYKSVKQEVSPADEIKKYKELLDIGAITQEEFEEKKRYLLGL